VSLSPLSANSDLMHRSKRHDDSITSSARGGSRRRDLKAKSLGGVEIEDKQAPRSHVGGGAAFGDGPSEGSVSVLPVVTRRNGREHVPMLRNLAVLHSEKIIVRGGRLGTCFD
jgi:hypothetical protein